MKALITGEAGPVGTNTVHPFKHAELDGALPTVMAAPCQKAASIMGRIASVLRRRGLSILLVASAVPAHRPALAHGIEADFEAGVVSASRNDVRIPGAGGTNLSLVNDLSAPPAPVFRLRAGYRLAERHLVTALYAPLRLNATGVLDRSATFAGQTYPAGSALLGVYRFDSYRLTYRYSFFRNETIEVAAGLTGKIRDAEISLYGPRTARKTNTGFVPLLNVHFEWRPRGGAFGVVLDADALAAPQGRAEDILVAATWAVTDGIVLRAGYRTVEGGAENDEVYNFTWLHYAVSGVSLRF
jgi:hypothetical protein